ATSAGESFTSTGIPPGGAVQNASLPSRLATWIPSRRTIWPTKSSTLAAKSDSSTVTASLGTATASSASSSTTTTSLGWLFAPSQIMNPTTMAMDVTIHSRSEERRVGKEGRQQLLRDLEHGTSVIS